MRSLFVTAFLALLVHLQVYAHPVERYPDAVKRGSSTKPSSASESTSTSDVVEHYGSSSNKTSASAGKCFPALGFKTPPSPPSSTDGWWCDYKEEYAFMGFGYEVTDCQSSSQLKKEFKDIREKFKGRYVRLYGACDKHGFFDNLIDAAWEAGIGVQALIWWGFDKDSNTIWKTRRDALIKNFHSNPKAKYVVRAVQFGSEPLFDGVLSAKDLAAQVKEAQEKLKDVGIPVTVSDLAAGYDNGAITAKKSWPQVENTLKFFSQGGKLGKKIYMTENGWPSEKNSMFTSKTAIADVQNEKDYYDLLDSKCDYFKSFSGSPGGVGWFAHLYSDDMEPGYGIYDQKGKMKFEFSPKTSC